MNRTKNTFSVIIALFVLFLTKWAFITLELNAEIDLFIYITESLFFLVIYSLCYCNVYPWLICVCLQAGSAGLCCLYGFFDIESGISCMIPICYTAVFLPLLSRNAVKKNITLLARICYVAMFAISVLLLGFIIYAGYGYRLSFSSDLVYSLIISILIAIVYGLMAASSVKSKKALPKKQKRIAVQEVAVVKQTHIISAVVIVESVLFAELEGRNVLAFTIRLLWIINLVFLFFDDCFDAGRFVRISLYKK